MRLGEIQIAAEVISLPSPRSLARERQTSHGGTARAMKHRTMPSNAVELEV